MRSNRMNPDSVNPNLDGGLKSEKRFESAKSGSVISEWNCSLDTLKVPVLVGLKSASLPNFFRLTDLHFLLKSTGIDEQLNEVSFKFQVLSFS